MNDTAMTARQLVGLAPGRTIGFEQFPRGSDAADPLVRAVHAAADALVALDDHAARLDPGWTDGEQRRALEAGHARVQVALAHAQAATDKAAQRLADAEAKFTSPASVSQVADVLADQELRRAFGELSPDERARVWDRLYAGELPDVLAALARFPLGVDGERARVIYRERQRGANPAKAQQLDEEAERLTWARTALWQVGDVLHGAAGRIGPSALVAA